jgi:hypothetical protein
MPENLGTAVRHKPDCPAVTEAMPPDVKLAVVLHDDGLVTVYSQEATTTEALASALHAMADGFLDAERRA